MPNVDTYSNVLHVGKLDLSIGCLVGITMDQAQMKMVQIQYLRDMGDDPNSSFFGEKEQLEAPIKGIARDGLRAEVLADAYLRAEIVCVKEGLQVVLRDVPIALYQTTSRNTYLAPCERSLDNLDIVSLRVTSVINDTEGLAKKRFGFQGSMVPCFTFGTEILTPDGPVMVQNLKVGDLIVTADNGAQKIRWLGRRLITKDFMSKNPSIRPVCIPAGTLGDNLPESDLVVSPQHRIMVNSRYAEKVMGAPEVFIAAKQLLALDDVEVAENLTQTIYYHLFFDQHEVVYANGTPTESLYPGPGALKAVGLSGRKELFSMFAELQAEGYLPLRGRPFAVGRMAARLMGKHLGDDTPLLSSDCLPPELLNQAA